MTRLTIKEHLIGNLRQSFPKNSYFYLTQEGAYRRLKHLTNQDFGYDADAWEKWFNEAQNPFPNAGIQYVETDEDI